MSRSIILTEPLTVRELAEQLEDNPISVIKALMGMGVMANINQTLDVDTATLVSEEMGYIVAQPEPEPVIEEEEAQSSVPDRMRLYRNEPQEKLENRPPVVTILGHVDHGKTTLLDRIRETRVVDREAGGITQHIGAYQVEKQGRMITFIDTPGHEAFTAMRRRGARGADVAVLVVAADDGMMPQTYEALDHVRAAGAHVVVALNKIDRENANPDRVYNELSEAGLIPEQYGGDTPVVSTSALRGDGIDELLDYILIVADLNQSEIVANPNRAAQGVVIESVVDPKRGITATLLVQNGTLSQGDSFVAGTVSGRVRAMFDWQGKRVKQAPPSTPVQVLGVADAPNAGDRFTVVKSNKIARTMAEERLAAQDDSGPARITLEDVYRQLQAGSVKSLNVVLKADVDGSLEPITTSLKDLDNEEVHINVLRADTGSITESDIMLAEASEAVVLGFGVEPDRGARERAESDNVEIRTYKIIYHLLDDMERAVTGMLDPVYEPVITGHAQVRQIFSVRRGKVAGCYVLDGKILRNGKARVRRGDNELWEGEISTLRRFQDDVREVAQGFECGISLKGFNDFEEGDIIEVYQMERVS